MPTEGDGMVVSRESVAGASEPDERTRTGYFRASAAQYLIALIVLLALTPLFESLSYSGILESVVLTAVLLTGALAVGARRNVFIAALVMVTPALILRWAHHLNPGLVPAPVYQIPFAVFVLFVFLNLLRFVLRTSRVDSEVLCAGVAGYITLGVIWTMFYLTISRLCPGSFAPASGQLDRAGAIYFSFITLTTTGYGDITPASNLSRMFAVLESITGTFYLAILISRLVALHTSNQSPNAGTPRSS